MHQPRKMRAETPRQCRTPNWWVCYDPFTIFDGGRTCAKAREEEAGLAAAWDRLKNGPPFPYMPFVNSNAKNEPIPDLIARSLHDEMTPDSPVK